MKITGPEVTVRRHMTERVITVRPDDNLRHATELLEHNGFHHLIVSDGDAVYGILSDRDLKLLHPSKAWDSTFHVELGKNALKVSQAMTRQVLTIDADASIGKAARMMIEQRVSALPVTSSKRIVGILSTTDLVRFVADSVGD